MKKFKDQCDECKKFDFLKGVNGKCLCQNCIKELYTIIQERQLTLFDMEVKHGK